MIPDYVNPRQYYAYTPPLHRQSDDKRARKANRTTVWGAEIQKYTTHLSGTLSRTKLLRIPLHAQVRVF